MSVWGSKVCGSVLVVVQLEHIGPEGGVRNFRQEKLAWNVSLPGAFVDFVQRAAMTTAAILPHTKRTREQDCCSFVDNTADHYMSPAALIAPQYI